MKKNPVVIFLFCPFPPCPWPRYYIYLFFKYVREEKNLNEKSEKKNRIYRDRATSSVPQAAALQS
jgi:hypothetical protein